MNHPNPQSDGAESASARVGRAHSRIRFPPVSLDRAIHAAATIQKSDGSRCSFVDFADLLDVPITTSTFRTTISAIRTFGLVRVSDDSLELTDLGMEIVDPTRQEAAIAKAFLTVPLFRAIHDAYGDHALPPTDELEEKIRSLGVTDRSATRARQILLRSARVAGFFQEKGAVPASRVIEQSAVAPHRPRGADDRAGESPVPVPPDKVPVPHQRHQLLGAIWEMLPIKGEFPEPQRSDWSRMLDIALNLVYGSTRGDSDEPEH